ncbi:A disintegrin and metalloproteinase with thrombospondin motifs 18-like [Sycon ciliatum]|uniref:A disintegrin and metalloproteinase with thrombospondin motifs 18-like n=1 Tax=Sycon ciliatum TaxID=27933 RepID=UPI0031F60B66
MQRMSRRARSRTMALQLALTSLLSVVAMLAPCTVAAESIRLVEDHARSFFKLQSHQAVPKHEVVFPVRRHHKTREFISHDTKLEPHRQRRSTTPSEHAAVQEPIHYSFNAFGDEFHLHLRNNYQLVSDDFSATILNDDGHNETLFEFPLCYYHGQVVSHGDSPVAVSNCHGLNGAMYVEDERFTIEPLPASMLMAEYNGTGEPHVISHSDQDGNGQQQQHGNASANNASSNDTERCYSQPEESPVEVAPEYVTLSSGVESTHPAVPGLGENGAPLNRSRRSAGEDGTAGARGAKYSLEVMLVLDQAMMRKRKFRTASEANTYALSLANLASLHFNRGMLGINLNFVVVRVLIANRSEDGLRIGHHSVKALRSFCQWQESRHYTPWDNHPSHYDLAILITGKELCPHQDHAGCAELGRAYVGGACYRYRMCSITYDYGIGTGFVMAHETGHSLNLTHDGHRYNENGCPSDKGTMMTAVVAGGKNVYTWSQCSKREVQKFVRSGQAYCLHDAPMRNLSRPWEMTGRRYSADDQCKLWLGPTSAVCPFSYVRDKRCSELWCRSSNNYCRTTHVPAAMGTPCGTGKVCYFGNCVADTFRRQAQPTTRAPRPVVIPAVERTEPPPRVEQPNRPNFSIRTKETPARRTRPPPVQVRVTTKVVVATTQAPPPVIQPQRTVWGDWMSHGKCSRTCGGGIQFFIRRCLQGRRFVATQNCDGEWYRVGLCKTKECPVESRGMYLKEQCIRAGRRLSNDPSEEWFPGYMAAQRCQLQCVSSMNRTYNSYVENGTPCSYRFNNRCVSGKCKAFGCDNKYESSAFWDKCGVCKGDGSTCRQYFGLHRPTTPGSNSTVLRLPKGARSIYIKEGAAVDSAFLYVRHLGGKVAIDGAWMRGRKQDVLKVYLAGTEFTYKQAPRRPEVLTSSIAPLNEDLVVEVVRLRQTSLSVQWRFLINPDDKDEDYVWSQIPERCSVTCGKGTRRTKTFCIRRSTQEQEEDQFCSTAGRKPTDKTTDCTLDSCPSGADWVTRAWTECSKSCDGGSQWRRVPCHASGKGVSKSLCRKPRPRTSRKCNLDPCPQIVKVHGKWSKFSQYSMCTRTCGGGVQYRRRTCTNPEPRNGGDYCEGPSLTARVCNSQECDSIVDFRTEQCAAYGRRGRTADGTKWIPHPEYLNQCKLVCTPKGGNQPVVKKSRAADGTRCHPFLNDRCTFGFCRTVGCDNEINSDAVEDRCGVCNGTGSTCQDFASRYNVKHFVKGVYRVFRIPKGARFLNISKSARSVNTSLVLADIAGNILLSSEILPSSAGARRSYGPVLTAYANYSRVAGQREYIQIMRPTTSDLVIMLNVSDQNRVNPHLRFEYTIVQSLHREPPTSEFYTWSRITSTCSVTCGRGVATTVSRCYRKRDGALVDSQYCRTLNRLPTVRTSRACETGITCPRRYTYEWSTGAWNACSSKCGKGIQNRTVQCRRAQDRIAVPNRYCRRQGLKTPNRRQSCIGRRCAMPAPAWIVGSWASCSVTCGTGRQTRQVTCQRYMPNEQCDGSPPTSVRTCQRGTCRPPPQAANHDTPHCRDQRPDDFCSLVLKYRLCKEGTEYFRLCCRTCTEARRRG